MEKYETTRIVRTHECGAGLRLNPESILNWIGDIAEEHAARLGFGYDAGVEHGLAWVELKLSIDIRRMPSWKEEVIVETATWPAGAVVAPRYFKLKDAEGETIVEIQTEWVLIDVQKRRPVALQKHLPFFSGKNADAPDTRNMNDIPGIATPNPVASYKAERHTIDFNRHVNNSYYLLWSLDAMPEDLAGQNISSIRIDFKKEAVYGDLVDIHADHSGQCSIFSLFREETELARVMITRAG